VLAGEPAHDRHDLRGGGAGARLSLRLLSASCKNCPLWQSERQAPAARGARGGDREARQGIRQCRCAWYRRRSRMGGVRVVIMGCAAGGGGAWGPGTVAPGEEAAEPVGVGAPEPEGARAVAPPPAEPPKVEGDPELVAIYASRRDGER